MMVVSETGDAWSPKMEPPNMAPAVRGMLTSMEMAMGSARTAIIAMVPMEVPVAKERIIVIMKVTAGSTAGVRKLENREER